MNQQRNKYNGEIDRKTKKRDGLGTYQYENQFFQYQGRFKQGIKEGKGKLIMGDGSIVEGEFINGELEGQGTITYPNGNYYKGGLKEGEKEGEGEWMLRGDKYIGQFHCGDKHGKGIYIGHNGDHIEGIWHRG